MKRKWALLLLALMAMNQGTTLMAKEPQAKTKEEQESKSEYLTKQEKVTEVTQEGDYYSILVGTPEDGIRFIVGGQELIINAESLEFLSANQIKESMDVTVVFPKDSPMGLSLPPVSSSQVAIIINSPNRFVEVGYFDENLTNETNTLTLIIGEDTCIMNSKGEKKIFTSDDIRNREAIVFYTVTTRSIPAQTVPQSVIILPTKEDEAAETNEPIDQVNEVEIKGEKYRAVREIATIKGYDVGWDNKNKTVTLTKGDNVIGLEVGQRSYTYNGEVKKINKEIILLNDIVYISNEVASEVIS